MCTSLLQHRLSIHSFHFFLSTHPTMLIQWYHLSLTVLLCFYWHAHAFLSCYLLLHSPLLSFLLFSFPSFIPIASSITLSSLSTHSYIFPPPLSHLPLPLLTPFRSPSVPHDRSAALHWQSGRRPSRYSTLLYFNLSWIPFDCLYSTAQLFSAVLRSLILQCNVM